MSALPRRYALLPFYAWLASFYIGWCMLVMTSGYLDTVLQHWPMALAMAFGSYVAGSTPMGGGTVGFPVLVLLMAFTSLTGIATKAAFGDLRAGTFENWLAAAPVIAVGAPFGAMVVTRIGRRPTLLFVSALCVLQFLWILHHERHALTVWSLSAALLGVVLFLLVFQDMYRHGCRLARRARARESAG